jgi:hypothetical protein
VILLLNILSKGQSEKRMFAVWQFNARFVGPKYTRACHQLSQMITVDHRLYKQPIVLAVTPTCPSRPGKISLILSH